MRRCRALLRFALFSVGLLGLFACSGQLQSTRVSSDVYLQRAYEYRRLNRPAQALYHVETLAAWHGWDDELRLLAGELRRQLADLDGAIAAWEGIESPSPAALRSLAQAQLDRGRWAAAARSFERLMDLDPDDAWALYHCGLLRLLTEPETAVEPLRMAGRSPIYAERSRALLDVIRADADPATTALRAGASLAQDGAWQLAELAFERAVDLDAVFAEAWAFLGVARAMQGKSGGTQVLHAVASEPANPRVRYLQGVYWRTQGDAAKAVDAFAQAAALDPENPAYYAELGQTYRALYDLAQAERWLQVAVVVSGDDPRYRELLALFYADEGMNLTASGLAVLEALAAALPEDADVKAGLGWALIAVGETERGEALIGEALALEPDNMRALYYTARLLLARDQRADAIRLFRQVAASESDFSALASAALRGLER